MKKYIVFAMLLGLVLATSVKAEENGRGSESGRPLFNSELKEKRDAFQEKMKENRDAFKQKMEGERKSFLDGLKKNREDFLNELKARKEEWRNANEERKGLFCEKAKEMVAERFEGAITQLEKLQTRVAEAIDKLEDGENTELAEDALELSKSKLADAKAKLAEVKALVPENCSEVTPETFEKIKLGAREAKDLLKESRESLRQAVKEIKALKEE